MVKKKVVKKIAKRKSVVKKPKKSKWECFYCGNNVEELDYQVLLITSNKGRITEKVCFHMDCYKEWFAEAVTKKAKENVAKVQKKVMGIMDNPVVKSMLSNVDGIQSLMGMLQTPLKKDVVEKVKEKINGKKDAKPRKKGKKA